MSVITKEKLIDELKNIEFIWNDKSYIVKNPLCFLALQIFNPSNIQFGVSRYSEETDTISYNVSDLNFQRSNLVFIFEEAFESIKLIDNQHGFYNKEIPFCTFLINKFKITPDTELYVVQCGEEYHLIKSIKIFDFFKNAPFFISNTGINIIKLGRINSQETDSFNVFSDYISDREIIGAIREIDTARKFSLDYLMIKLEEPAFREVAETLIPRIHILDNVMFRNMELNEHINPEDDEIYQKFKKYIYLISKYNGINFQISIDGCDYTNLFLEKKYNVFRANVINAYFNTLYGKEFKVVDYLDELEEDYIKEGKDTFNLRLAKEYLISNTSESYIRMNRLKIDDKKDSELWIKGISCDDMEAYMEDVFEEIFGDFFRTINIRLRFVKMENTGMRSNEYPKFILPETEQLIMVHTNVKQIVGGPITTFYGQALFELNSTKDEPIDAIIAKFYGTIHEIDEIRDYYLSNNNKHTEILKCFNTTFHIPESCESLIIHDFDPEFIVRKASEFSRKKGYNKIDFSDIENKKMEIKFESPDVRPKMYYISDEMFDILFPVQMD